jgi:uridine phosphorylase
MPIDLTVPPILQHKDHSSPSVFTADGLLREARRQKGLDAITVPVVCVLDPDGDLIRRLRNSGRAFRDDRWACYHTELYRLSDCEAELGFVGFAVGAPFAVLVAEELFACGCQLLISITSAGQLLPIASPPYFVLIDRALRDEGTSHHYLPPSRYSEIRADLLQSLSGAFAQSRVPVHRGATWTTDAPFRETAEAIAARQKEGLLAVEMEAAALYALAAATDHPVVCFALVTNRMALVDGDFEKGTEDGTVDALALIRTVIKYTVPENY